MIDAATPSDDKVDEKDVVPTDTEVFKEEL